MPTSRRILQNVRERLVLILLGLLPFHALLVTVFTKIILGPGHAPLPMIALWKEMFLLTILVLCCVEALKSKKSWRIDRIDACIFALLLLAAAPLTLEPPPFFTTAWIYGFKYDFLPLVVFVFLRRVHWSDVFQAKVITILLFDAILVGLFAIFNGIAPPAFFTFLGYSDLHSLYLPDGPIAAFQQIEGIALRRIQSTFSGPNQLGLWLLLPYAAYLASLRSSSPWRRHGMILFFLLIVLTFSRTALIAFFLMTVADFFLNYKRKEAWFRSTILSVPFIILFGLAVAWFPDLLLRATSTRGHWERPLAAVQTMIEHPFGLGLGSAGPASNRTSDACVFLSKGSDASWAQDRKDLCVFVGDAQVQPLGRTCRCPLLPENWYLQIGVELGVMGLLLYLSLMAILFCRLISMVCSENAPPPLLQITYLSLLGIGCAALFLHAWEESAVAYTLWILMSMQFSAHRHLSTT